MTGNSGGQEKVVPRFVARSAGVFTFVSEAIGSADIAGELALALTVLFEEQRHHEFEVIHVDVNVYVAYERS